MKGSPNKNRKKFVKNIINSENEKLELRAILGLMGFIVILGLLFL